MDSSQIPPKARTVRQEPSFDAEATALDPDVKRLDERLSALMWAVSTKPEACPAIPGTKYRFVWIAVDVVGALFTIDSPDECTLWHLIAQPPQDPEV